MKTKIFKQFICTLLVISVIFSLSATAFAIDDVDITPEYEDEVIDESTYIVDESELVHTPYNPPSEDEIPVENPDCQIIHDDPEDPMVTTYSTRAAYGPYTSLETMVDQKMNVIVNGLKNSGGARAVKYSGYNCYKFTYSGTTVYVTCDTFYRQQNAKPVRSISADATAATNNRETDKVYTTIVRSSPYTYNGMTVYRWSFARVGGHAYHAKNNTVMIMSVELQQAYDFDAYYASLQDIGGAKMKISPTMAIKVTNSGNGIYFDSYEFKGLGEDTSRTSLGALINIAFSGKRLIGTITSSVLSVGTLLNVCDAAVNLIKHSSSSNRKDYLTDTAPLYNANRYLYKFETPTPFPLRINRDFSTMTLGITGTVTSGTKYNTYYGWTVS